MDYIIEGKHKLQGELPVYGAKNCALALLGATLLTDDAVTLFNCPDIVDVENMLQILRSLGKKVERIGETVTVCGTVVTTDIPQHLARLLRGSGLLLGSMISRYHKAFLPSTGGCAIGSRPIDIHLDGLRAMRVQVMQEEKGVECLGQPQGCVFNLRFASVGATENLLCAAALANGDVTLTNCALEPEVVALEQLLQKMGANIRGVGTSKVSLCGTKSLHGAEFQVIPDRIVAATYLSCVASAGGYLTVTNCCPAHLGAFLKVLQGRFDLKICEDAVTMSSFAQPRDYGKTVTAPYPHFPTDMQQLLLSLCAASSGGISYISEKLFENRLLHNAQQLNKMGADVTVEGDTARIVGKKLHGATVSAQDLRGGAALVVAALGAEGQSKICNAHHIFRGYSNLAESLCSVGANISVF